MHKSIALQLSRERDDRPEVCTALAQHAGLGAMHELATVAQDRWRQGKCLARATMIELERGQPLRARERAQVLREAASTCDDGAEVALARAINVLTRPPAAQDTSAESSLADLAAAIDDLRTANDKSRLAWVLNFAAVSQWDAGAFKQACVLADDALATALLIGDQTEAVVARATLAQLALARSDTDQARTVACGLQAVYAAPSEFSARARRAAQSPRLNVLAEPRATSAPVRPADEPTSP